VSDLLEFFCGTWRKNVRLYVHNIAGFTIDGSQMFCPQHLGGIPANAAQANGALADDDI
jgi:hypothetical protein